MQHSYCTDISWEDARPGDLVFYPDNSHVGIVGGRDANGELLIIHCASGYNNVVITGKEGFTSVGRPNTTQIDEEGRRTSAGPLFEGEAYAKEVDCILHGIAADHAADGFCVCGCTAL